MLQWHGDEAIRTIDAASDESVQRAAVYFWERLQDELGVSAKVGRGTKKKDYAASAPGEPPRKRTGWLQRHVLWLFEQSYHWARVGLSANAIYGLYLEFGTKRMLARPWLFATLRKYQDQIRAHLENGGNKAGASA